MWRTVYFEWLYSVRQPCLYSKSRPQACLKWAPWWTPWLLTDESTGKNVHVAVQYGQRHWPVSKRVWNMSVSEANAAESTTTPWKWPTDHRPVFIIIALLKEKCFWSLILIDRHSKWLEVCHMFLCQHTAIENYLLLFWTTWNLNVWQCSTVYFRRV